MLKPRRRFRFWGLAAIMVVFNLLGVLFLIVGPDREARLTGLMCILFFGVGGLAFFGNQLFTRRGPGTLRRERVETSAGTELAFVFPTPPAKQRAAIIACGGMAAGSALLIPLGNVVAGAVCASVFGLFFLLGLIFSRRPQQLQLTPTRLVATAGAGTVELPWDAVAGAEIYAMPAGRATVDMVGVTATDPDAAVWTRGGALGRLGRRMAGYDLTAAADSFAGEGEDVVAAILRYRDDPGRRRAIGGEDEHARLLRELGEA